MTNLSKFLNYLNQAKFDAFIINSSNEYLDEFTPHHLNRLKWLTNFSGSNGMAIISQKHKIFFTDGRYLTQAKKELPKEFIIYDLGSISLKKWIAKHLPNDSKLAYDSRCFTAGKIREIKKFTKNYGIKLYRINENPIDIIWKREIPKNKNAEIISTEFSGLDIKEKIKSINFFNQITGKQAYLTCDSASICWLLNLRGFDNKYTPLLHSYFLYNHRKSFLFTNSTLLDDNIKKYLSEQKIEVIDLQKISQFANICLKNKIKLVNLDQDYISYYFYGELKNNKIEINTIKDPLIKAKSIKNKIEIENLKSTHIIDGLAVTKFLAWCDNIISNNEISNHNEITIKEKLHEYRCENDEFLFNSFETISAYSDNGAIIHYCPNDINNKKIANDSLLLIDSGGQYKSATTDITRTIATGIYSKDHIHNYTLVLKGHIALATAIFPKNTSGHQLDCLARQYLWKEQKDFNHGTGHGVGNFLNVHEGPHSISKANNNTPLEAGMLVTNEPGYYVENNYGIRIENIMLVVEESKNFLKFETVSLAPLDEKLIDFSLLDQNEKNWLKNYHNKIYKLMEDRLSESEKLWLIKKNKIYN
jgi:Xaa-Pro aminopeptidase